MDTDYFSTVQLMPPTIGATIALALALVLLLVSGFISASEIAFFSLTHQDKAELGEEKRPIDKIISRLLSKSEYLLATILIVNNLVNISVVILSTYFITTVVKFGESHVLGFVSETILLTFLLLLFGEIMPKIYASYNSLKFARFSAGAVNTLAFIFHPLATLLVRSTHVVNRHIHPHNINISMNEISQALEMTDVKGTEEKQMLKEIIKFGDKTVEKIMTARVDITDVDITLKFPDLIALIVDTNYSRLPVYESNQDNIKGIIYTKDLLPYLNEGENFAWQQLMRAAYFVPENKMIDNLLEEFRSQKIHMAIVVDEFGGTSGIVTLEDVLEEIVGEINDEYDEEERNYIRIDDDTFIFEGKTFLNDFFKYAHLSPSMFDKLTEEADTLAGLILELKEDLPKSKEKIYFKNILFTMLEVDKRRIVKVKVHIDREADTL